jgi:hypothetical protein
MPVLTSRRLAIGVALAEVNVVPIMRMMERAPTGQPKKP